MLFKIVNNDPLLAYYEIPIIYKADSEEDAISQIKDSIMAVDLAYFLEDYCIPVDAKDVRITFTEKFNIQLETLDGEVIMKSDVTYTLENITKQVAEAEKLLNKYCNYSLADVNNDYDIKGCDFNNGIDFEISAHVDWDKFENYKLFEINVILDNQLQTLTCLEKRRRLEFGSSKHYYFYSSLKDIYYTEAEFIEKFKPAKFVKDKLLNCSTYINHMTKIDERNFELTLGCLYSPEGPNNTHYTAQKFVEPHGPGKTFNDYLEEYGDEDTASLMELIDREIESSKEDVSQTNTDNQLDLYKELVRITYSEHIYDVCRIQSFEDNNVGYYWVNDGIFILDENATETIEEYMNEAKKRQARRKMQTIEKFICNVPFRDAFYETIEYIDKTVSSELADLKSIIF